MADDTKRGKVAILVGGGPAPGINGVIGSATLVARDYGLKVIGCYDGFKHLVKPPGSFDKKEHTTVLERDVSRIHFEGGSILRTSRTSLILKEKPLFSLEAPPGDLDLPPSPFAEEGAPGAPKGTSCLKPPERLRQAFQDHGCRLTGEATLEVSLEGDKWRILDGKRTYVIKAGKQLQVLEELGDDDPVEPDAEKVGNVRANLEKLGVDYLITIGGDDTSLSARFVAEDSPVRVVHVPKTIDNDLPLPDDMPTFGFETARHVGAELVHNLMSDSRTTNRWYIVVAMGRSAGHLALGMTRASGATLALIPEEFPEKVTSDHIAAVIEGAMIKRKAQGSEHGVAIIAEGIGYKLDDIEKIEQLMGRPVPRDEFGHPRWGEVPLADIFRDAVKARCAERKEKAELVSITIGYELRCASPVAFDVAYTRDLGHAAVLTLLDKTVYPGEVAGMLISINTVNGKINPIPFGQLADETGRTRVRRVDVESALYRAAYDYMIRLRPRDLKDNRQAAKLAQAAGLEVAQLRERFQQVAARPWRKAPSETGGGGQEEERAQR